VPNTEAITTGPGATSETGSGAPDAETELATTGSDPAPVPEPAPSPPSGRLPHIRALDGLRGLAVLGVLVYHLELGWMPGGFLGVSLFFTLSGFLITSLVLAERAEHGRVAMGRFWARRFRRLLPAAWAGLALAVLFSAFAGDADQLRRLPGDVWASLAYVANWRFLFAGDAYAAGYQEPSPILHYWSLAIEEQFYVIFPVVVAGLIAWKATRRIWFGVMGSALVLSMVCTIVFFDAHETSRVYFSSLTRMAEILAGVLLALVLEGWWRGVRSTAPAATPDAAGVATSAAPGTTTADATTVVEADGSATSPLATVQPVTRATLERLARGAHADDTPTVDPDQVIVLGPGAAPDDPPAPAPAKGSAATTSGEPDGGPDGEPDSETAAAGEPDDPASTDGLPPGSPLLRRSPVPTLADGNPRTWISVATCVALAVVVLLWIRASTTDEWVYRGGLWLVAALSCVLVIGAITAGPVASALAWRPLVFCGAISYGIYVYHWPLFLWLSPERVGLDGLALAIIRVAVTFAVALASYHWLERPIREGRVPLTWATGSVALAAVLVVGIAAINLGTQADARAVDFAISADDTPVITRPAITSPSATMESTSDTGPQAPVAPPTSVLFIGDSLLHQAYPVIKTHFAELGIASDAIGGPGTSVLYDQSRWLGELDAALAESQPDVVVIESCCGYDENAKGGTYTLLGAPLVPDTDETWLVWQTVADQMVQKAADSGALVLWVLAPPARTTGYYGPIEGRIDRANDIALGLPDRHPCVGFVDWRVIAADDGSYTPTLPGVDGEPVKVRADDGLHFTPAGMNVLAQVSRTAVIDDWEDSPATCVGDRRSP
jgi:peptidoglycan/LPS O-acetylase OafA/YrhL